MATARRPRTGISPDAPAPIGRVFAIIELMAASGTVSVGQIVEMLSIPRPTAHRMIAMLEDMGYLQKLPGRSGYGPAPRLVGLASDIMGSTAVYAAVHTTLADLAAKVGETCSLAMLSGGEVEYIASAYGNSPLTLQFQAGQKTPVHCTSSGRIFLANMTEERREAFLSTGPWQPVTPHTVTDPRRMREELNLVRERDYAMNDSEFIVGVVGAAVPVRNTDDRLMAVLTISAPKARLPLDRMAGLIPAMKSAAARIARSL